MPDWTAAAILPEGTVNWNPVAYGLQEQPNLDSRTRSILARLSGLVVLAVVVLAGFLLFSSQETVIEPLSALPRALGRSAIFKVRLSNPQGVRRVVAAIEQNGSRYEVFSRKWDGGWTDWVRKGRDPVTVEFNAGKDQAPGLMPGAARLVIEVEANNLRGRKSSLVREVPVVLGRPEIQVEKKTVSLRRGGTGVVAFRVGGEWSEAGARVGKYTFPSFAVKGEPGRRVALFAYPIDVEEDTPPQIYARNLAGDEVTAVFPHYVAAVKFRERELKITDAFLRKTVPAIDPSGSGDLAARYARLNSEVRRTNDAFLSELGHKSAPQRLWKGSFQLLPKSIAEARYGDRRTYIYNDKELNREWHLGSDLASTKHAPLPAGNSGVVVFAGPLGIYGNCVVIDHGLGVQSVYGHLSVIQVKVGDKVDRGQLIGHTGMTGLAGGDHVHVSIQLDGVFVDPVEWSFAKWMEKSVMPRLSQIE